MKSPTTILFFFLTFLFSNLTAQESNPDVLFSEVKNFAELKNYEQAITQVKTLVATYPKNQDYSVYLARLYYWSEKYGLAEIQTLNIIAENPANIEAFNLLVKIKLALKKYQELLLLCEQGILLFPTESDFYTLHKSFALENLGKSDDAIVTLNSIQHSSGLYKEAQNLKVSILKKQENIVSVGYLNTSFSNPDLSPWHFGILEYIKKTKKGAYAGRVTYGNLLQNNALQAEADAYPKLSKNAYLYLNAGFSDGKSIFPLLRLGGEFYQDVKQYNFSVGSRYLHFNESDVLMLTGHAAINFNMWKLSYRPFLVNQFENWFPSHIINVRKSFESKEAYIQFDMQYGGLPYNFFITNELSKLNAFRTGFDFKFRVKDNFFIQTIFMYEMEEFIPSEFRNRYNVQMNFSKRF